MAKYKPTKIGGPSSPMATELDKSLRSAFGDSNYSFEWTGMGHDYNVRFQYAGGNSGFQQVTVDDNRQSIFWNGRQVVPSATHEGVSETHPQATARIMAGIASGKIVASEETANHIYVPTNRAFGSGEYTPGGAQDNVYQTMTNGLRRLPSDVSYSAFGDNTATAKIISDRYPNALFLPSQLKSGLIVEDSRPLINAMPGVTHGATEQDIIGLRKNDLYSERTNLNRDSNSTFQFKGYGTNPDGSANVPVTFIPGIDSGHGGLTITKGWADQHEVEWQRRVSMEMSGDIKDFKLNRTGTYEGNAARIGYYGDKPVDYEVPGANRSTILDSIRNMPYAAQSASDARSLYPVEYDSLSAAHRSALEAGPNQSFSQSGAYFKAVAAFNQTMAPLGLSIAGGSNHGGFVNERAVPTIDAILGGTADMKAGFGLGGGSAKGAEDIKSLDNLGLGGAGIREGIVMGVDEGFKRMQDMILPAIAQAQSPWAGTHMPGGEYPEDTIARKWGIKSSGYTEYEDPKSQQGTERKIVPTYDMSDPDVVRASHAAAKEMFGTEKGRQELRDMGIATKLGRPHEFQTSIFEATQYKDSGWAISPTQDEGMVNVRHENPDVYNLGVQGVYPLRTITHGSEKRAAFPGHQIMYSLGQSDPELAKTMLAEGMKSALPNYSILASHENVALEDREYTMASTMDVVDKARALQEAATGINLNGAKPSGEYVSGALQALYPGDKDVVFPSPVGTTGKGEVNFRGDGAYIRMPSPNAQAKMGEYDIAGAAVSSPTAAMLRMLEMATMNSGEISPEDVQARTDEYRNNLKSNVFESKEFRKGLQPFRSDDARSAVLKLTGSLKPGEGLWTGNEEHRQMLQEMYGYDLSGDDGNTLYMNKTYAAAMLGGDDDKDTVAVRMVKGALIPGEKNEHGEKISEDKHGPDRMVVERNPYTGNSSMVALTTPGDINTISNETALAQMMHAVGMNPKDVDAKMAHLGTLTGEAKMNEIMSLTDQVGKKDLGTGTFGMQNKVGDVQDTMRGAIAGDWMDSAAKNAGNSTTVGDINVKSANQIREGNVGVAYNSIQRFISTVQQSGLVTDQERNRMHAQFDGLNKQAIDKAVAPEDQDKAKAHFAMLTTAQGRGGNIGATDGQMHTESGVTRAGVQIMAAMQGAGFDAGALVPMMRQADQPVNAGREAAAEAFISGSKFSENGSAPAGFQKGLLQAMYGEGSDAQLAKNFSASGMGSLVRQFAMQSTANSIDKDVKSQSSAETFEDASKFAASASDKEAVLATFMQKHPEDAESFRAVSAQLAMIENTTASDNYDPKVMLNNAVNYPGPVGDYMRTGLWKNMEKYTSGGEIGAVHQMSKTLAKAHVVAPMGPQARLLSQWRDGAKTDKNQASRDAAVAKAEANSESGVPAEPMAGGASGGDGQEPPVDMASFVDGPEQGGSGPYRDSNGRFAKAPSGVGGTAASKKLLEQVAEIHEKLAKIDKSVSGGNDSAVSAAGALAQNISKIHGLSNNLDTGQVIKRSGTYTTGKDGDIVVRAGVMKTPGINGEPPVEAMAEIGARVKPSVDNLIESFAALQKQVNVTGDAYADINAARRSGAIDKDTFKNIGGAFKALGDSVPSPDKYLWGTDADVGEKLGSIRGTAFGAMGQAKSYQAAYDAGAAIDKAGDLLQGGQNKSWLGKIDDFMSDPQGVMNIAGLNGIGWAMFAKGRVNSMMMGPGREDAKTYKDSLAGAAYSDRVINGIDPNAGEGVYHDGNVRSYSQYQNEVAGGKASSGLHGIVQDIKDEHLPPSWQGNMRAASDVSKTVFGGVADFAIDAWFVTKLWKTGAGFLKGLAGKGAANAVATTVATAAAEASAGGAAVATGAGAAAAGTAGAAGTAAGLGAMSANLGIGGVAGAALLGAAAVASPIPLIDLARDKLDPNYTSGTWANMRKNVPGQVGEAISGVRSWLGEHAGWLPINKVMDGILGPLDNGEMPGKEDQGTRPSTPWSSSQLQLVPAHSASTPQERNNNVISALGLDGLPENPKTGRGQNYSQPNYMADPRTPPSPTGTSPTGSGATVVNAENVTLNVSRTIDFGEVLKNEANLPTGKIADIAGGIVADGTPVKFDNASQVGAFLGYSGSGADPTTVNRAAGNIMGTYGIGLDDFANPNSSALKLLTTAAKFSSTEGVSPDQAVNRMMAVSQNAGWETPTSEAGWAETVGLMGMNQRDQMTMSAGVSALSPVMQRLDIASAPLDQRQASTMTVGNMFMNANPIVANAAMQLAAPTTEYWYNQQIAQGITNNAPTMDLNTFLPANYQEQRQIRQDQVQLSNEQHNYSVGQQRMDLNRNYEYSGAMQALNFAGAQRNYDYSVTQMAAQQENATASREYQLFTQAAEEGSYEDSRTENLNQKRISRKADQLSYDYGVSQLAKSQARSDVSYASDQHLLANQYAQMELSNQYQNQSFANSAVQHDATYSYQMSNMQKSVADSQRMFGMDMGMRGISRQLMTAGFAHQGTMFDIQTRESDMSFGHSMASMDLQASHIDQSLGMRLQERGMQRSMMVKDFNFQEDTMGINRGRQEEQAEWSQSDLASGRERQDLQFGWQQEDSTRNIRLATGRQKQELIRQRNRNAILHGLDSNSQAKQQSRLDTKEGWDTEDYDRNSDRFQENKKDQLGMFDMQTGHTIEQAGMQKASLNLAREQAKERKALSDEALNENKRYFEETMALQTKLFDAQTAKMVEVNKIAMENAAIQEKQAKEDEARYQAQNALNKEKMGSDQGFSKDNLDTQAERAAVAKKNSDEDIAAQVAHNAVMQSLKLEGMDSAAAAEQAAYDKRKVAINARNNEETRLFMAQESVRAGAAKKAADDDKDRIAAEKLISERREADYVIANNQMIVQEAFWTRSVALNKAMEESTNNQAVAYGAMRKDMEAINDNLMPQVLDWFNKIAAAVGVKPVPITKTTSINTAGDIYLNQGITPKGSDPR